MEGLEEEDVGWRKMEEEEVAEEEVEEGEDA